MKFSGRVRVESKDANGKIISIYESHNMIVDDMLEVIIADFFVTSGAMTGKPIYRLMIGAGGYTLGVKNKPTNAWHTYTNLITPVGSQGLDTVPITTSFDAVTHTLQLTAECEIKANDYGLTGILDINEIGLIAGYGTLGLKLEPAHLGVNDIMVAYNTIDALAMNVGDTHTISWVIGVRKEVV